MNVCSLMFVEFIFLILDSAVLKLNLTAGSLVSIIMQQIRGATHALVTILNE